MKITSVTYRRLRSFGNYENEAVEATATVSVDNCPDETLASLKDWVEDRLSIRGEVEELNYRCEAKRNELCDLERNIADAEKQWEKAVNFLAKHGLDTPEALPF